ncbi:MAG: family N-acetyltransferase [Mucilaginibacter sp.]|nr:family N-acetyltransferase [Mucilaginibacter sp.]
MLNHQVLIRDANEGDIGALTVLMNELGYSTSFSEMENRFKNITVHPDYKTLVAIVNNEIVGMAGLAKGISYEKNGSYMRIVAFVVNQNRRKNGVGKALMTASEDWAISQNLNTIVISSRNIDQRRAAHAFYLKMGYAIKSSGFVKQL